MEKKYRTLEDAINEADKVGGAIRKVTPEVYDFLPGLWYGTLRFFGYRRKDYVVTYKEADNESNRGRK